MDLFYQEVGITLLKFGKQKYIKKVEIISLITIDDFMLIKIIFN